MIQLYVKIDQKQKQYSNEDGNSEANIKNGLELDCQDVPSYERRVICETTSTTDDKSHTMMIKSLYFMWAFDIRYHFCM